MLFYVTRICITNDPVSLPDFIVPAFRKMCVVVQHHLGKGARCAPPLHPPGPWRSFGIEPNRASKTYRRLITRRAWRYASPPAQNHARTVWPVEHHLREASTLPQVPHGQRYAAEPQRCSVGKIEIFQI